MRGSSSGCATRAPTSESLKLPVESAGRNYAGEFGCDELTEDDAVTVKGGGTFKASIYNLDAPRHSVCGVGRGEAHRKW